MRLATIKRNGKEIGGIVTKKGILPIESINAAKGTSWKETLFDLIQSGQLSELTDWYAGDVLSTGTPRAFEIHDGDVAECRFKGPDGFQMEPLTNPVVDLKKSPFPGDGAFQDPDIK